MSAISSESIKVDDICDQCGAEIVGHKEANARLRELEAELAAEQRAHQRCSEMLETERGINAETVARLGAENARLRGSIDSVLPYLEASSDMSLPIKPPEDASSRRPDSATVLGLPRALAALLRYAMGGSTR